jgi:hypothetical protein
MLRKKASRDERLAQLSDRSALLYVLSIPHLDIDGRMIGLPETVRGLVVPEIARARPADWSDEQVGSYMLEWTATHDQHERADPLVLWYAAVGESVCFFRGFSKNQSLRRDKEAPSRLPAPPPELLEQPALASAGMALSPALRRVIIRLTATLRGDSGPEGEAEEESIHAGTQVARAREATPQGLQVAQTVEQALSVPPVLLPGLDLDTSRVVSISGFGDRAAGDTLIPDDAELARIAADLRGADDGTLHLLKVWRRRGCGEREFAIAVESLKRRRASEKRPLDSEARYVTAELSRLLRERAA